MLVDIGLSMLDRYRPLVIKARREKDTAIRQEEPVGIRDTQVNLPPGPVVSSTLVTEHSTTLCANLGNMHRHLKFINDAHIPICQLFRETAGVCMGFPRAIPCERPQAGMPRHR